MKIIVDKREIRNSSIYKHLLDFGLEVVPSNLNIGDFVISDNIVIERKTSSDFISSILDKRLFRQIDEMRDNYKDVYLIVEDYEDLFNSRFNEKVIKGAILSCLSKDVRIIYSNGVFETAEYLYMLCKNVNKELKEISLRIKKPKELREIQQYFIEGIPLIGPTTAKELLKKFKSPYNIFTASEKDLLKVKGFGKVRLKILKSVLFNEWKNNAIS